MKCSDCNTKLTTNEMANRSDYPMCSECEFDAEMENAHSDGHHESENGGFDILCKACQATLYVPWNSIADSLNGAVIPAGPYYSENPILNSLFEGRRFAQIHVSQNPSWIDSF